MRQSAPRLTLSVSPCAERDRQMPVAKSDKEYVFKVALKRSKRIFRTIAWPVHPDNVKNPKRSP